MVLTHRSWSEVITSTTRSRSGPVKPLSAKNLADFLPLPFWECSNVKLFLPPGALSLLLLGASAQEVAYPHAEPIGHQVGYPQNDDYRCGKVGPGYPGYYGKVGNRAINGAEDEITYVAMLWPGLESGPEGLRGMGGLNLGRGLVGMPSHVSSPFRLGYTEIIIITCWQGYHKIVL
jgi:hypothetical protein